MLTKKLACPSCGAGLKVADTLAEGKRIKCPKCGLGFPVPAGTSDSGGVAGAESSKPRQTINHVGAIAGASKTQPRPRAEKVEDPDEELEERPRRKKLRRKKKRARNTPLILGLIGVLVLLIGGGATLAVVFWPFGKKAQAVAENNPSRSGPAPAGRSGSVESGQADGGSQQFAAGRTVFETNNCARCHTIGGAGSSSGGFGGPRGGFGGQRGGGPGMGRNRGPDLGTVGRDPSHTVDWLKEQIRNPKSHKADARMPAFEAIKDDDLRALAEYLASLK